jgi:hypothetical protein
MLKNHLKSLSYSSAMEPYLIYAELHQIRMVPKAKLMKATYRGRCLSIVLLDSLGMDGARNMSRMRLGYRLSNQSKASLNRLQQKHMYHLGRQRTQKFKRSRYVYRAAKQRLHMQRQLSMQCARGIAPEHHYAAQ